MINSQPPARQVYHVAGNLSSPDFKAAVWGLYERQDLAKLNIQQVLQKTARENQSLEKH